MGLSEELYQHKTIVAWKNKAENNVDLKITLAISTTFPRNPAFKLHKRNGGKVLS